MNKKHIVDQFIPYELAVKLKELGFDEDCLATYHKELHNIIPIYAEFREGDIIKAPLWQQAFDFFEKFNIYSYIDKVSIGSDEWEYRYIISYLPIEFKDYKRRAIHFIEINSFIEGFGTYSGAWSDKNEARRACLEKLLEIGER